MEENQTPTPLPTEASAKEGPVSAAPPVIPDLIRDPVPPVSEPVKPNRKFSLKLVIGIIIFLLLAGAAASFTVLRPQIMSLVAKPTPSPTVIPDLIRDPSPTPDSWKTYSGNAIEFKYPPNGKIITNNSTDIHISGETEPYFTFKVNLQDNVKNLETKQVVDNLISDLKNNKNAPWAKSQADQMQQSMKDYTTGQIRGIKLQSFDEGYPQKFGEVIMVKSNKIYAFTIGNGSGGGVSDEDEIRLDQILSTFKFTDSDVTPVPTCMQRPACLNATPRCMIAEPASGWCP